MNVEYSLSESLSYHGGEFKLIDNKTIGFISGASITLWNLQNGKKQYIWSERNGFQFFTVNHKRGLIAVAECGLNPKIFLYQYPKLNVTLELSNLIPLEVLDLDISRDGNKLLIVSGVPNYEVIIYDCLKKEKLQGKNCLVPIKQKFIKARFNPANENLFFVLYENGLYLHKILPAFELSSQNALTKMYRIETNQVGNFDGITLVSAIWDDDNKIYLASNSQITLINSEDFKETVTKDISAAPGNLVLTQRHLILCYKNNLIEWLFKFDPNLNDEDRKALAVDKYYILKEGSVSEIMYDHYMQELLVGTQEGLIIMLPLQAESNADEFDDDQPGDKTPSDDENKKEEKQLELEVKKVGPFHTSEVIYIKELKNLDILISIARDGSVFIWNLNESAKSVIKSYQFRTETNKAQISADDKLLIIGSMIGCLRIIDITDLLNFQVKKIFKFYKSKEISSLCINPDNSIISVSSQKSKKVFFISANPDIDYKILGYSYLPDKVNSIYWLESAKHPVPSNTNVLLVLVNYLLIVIVPPNPNGKYANLKLELDQCPQYGRKIDPDLYLIVVDPTNGDILLTGKDKILKKYKQPDELIIKMDLRIKVPGSIPLEELDGHPLPTNCLIISPNNSMCVTGGSDGSIFIRNLKMLSNVTEIKAHNYKSFGVSALTFSSNSYLLFSGGKDGSIFLWELNPHEFTKGVNFVTKSTNEYGVNELNAIEDNKVKFYKEVLEEEYNKTQLENRSKTKKQMKDAVTEIKNKLNQLLRNNRLADDLEKLPRDDFVIDVEARDKILKDGENKKQELRENAKKEIHKQEIIHKRIKERTWDSMDTQLKAINGLRENFLVYNYNIRKRLPEELRRLKMIYELRRQEIKERLKREENNLKEIIIVSDLFKKAENYIINVISGLPTLILNDYEIQEENLEKRKEAAAGGAGFKSTQGGPQKKVGLKKPLQATKKEEEKAKEDEEKKKQEEALKQEANLQVQKQKKGPDDLGDWDYLYGAFELFTNNRKRNQIYFIQNVIYKIKQEYNKEFETLVQFRLTQLENIHERRKRINEIVLDLQKDEELLDPKKNLLEDPSIVLKILDGEIKIEKYLSKEERDRREAERLKEEERIRAQMADDSGQRALRDMMGGTLEEKKETALTETLQREEWMNKPVDEMTEEEKLKMREYEVKEQKMNEEKEKMRKNLENELKNLKNQIEDICFKFDEKLLILFKRKLEYDQRIYEQELYIIRLVLSMIWQYKSSSILKELETSKTQIVEKQDHYKEIAEKLEELKNEIDVQRSQVQESFNNAFEAKGRNERQNVEPTKTKNIYLLVFEDTKNDKKKKKQETELMEKPEYKKILIKLDPYLEIEKRELKKQRDEFFENYMDEINEKTQNFDDETTKEFVLSQLSNKFNLKKELEKYEAETKNISSYIGYFDQEFKEVQASLAQNIKQYDTSTSFLSKNRSNIEVQVRMKQGLVEIPQEIPVPNLSEAILIPKTIIESRNKDIKKQGEKKIKAMEDIKEIKMNVKKAEYDLNLKNLIIKETELKTKEVQMLRVTKEMQIALSKQDTKMHNEYELKNLQDQIDKIRQTTEKRIGIYIKKQEKLEKDIQFIKKENEQLKLQGANLMATVKQRKEIHDMMFHKKAAPAGGIGGGNNTLLIELNEKEKKEKDGYDNESFEKFLQISRNRKLFDEAKRQTQEIELLREELNKLKSKTFANFSNAKRSFI